MMDQMKLLRMRPPASGDVRRGSGEGAVRCRAGRLRAPCSCSSSLLETGTVSGATTGPDTGAGSRTGRAVSGLAAMAAVGGARGAPGPACCYVASILAGGARQEPMRAKANPRAGLAEIEQGLPRRPRARARPRDVCEASIRSRTGLMGAHAFRHVTCRPRRLIATKKNGGQPPSSELALPLRAR